MDHLNIKFFNIESLPIDILNKIFKHIYPGDRIVFDIYRYNGICDQLISTTCKLWFKLLMDINNVVNIWGIEILNHLSMEFLRSTKYPPSQITIDNAFTSKRNFIYAFMKTYEPNLWKNIKLPSWNDLYAFANSTHGLNFYFEKCVDNGSYFALLYIINLYKENCNNLYYFKMKPIFFNKFVELYEYGKVSSDIIDKLIQYYEITPFGLAKLIKAKNTFPFELIKKYAEIPMMYNWDDCDKKIIMNAQEETKIQAYYEIWKQYQYYIVIKIHENRNDDDPFILLPKSNEYMKGFRYFYKLLPPHKITDAFKFVQENVSHFKYNFHVEKFLDYFDNILI